MSNGRCRACGAANGYCQWSCEAVQALEDSHARAVTAHADGLIGRWMSVDASKLYAVLHYSAEARGK